jgi:DNA-binding transcriptional regulator YdaS (Cro superfamily)
MHAFAGIFMHLHCLPSCILVHFKADQKRGEIMLPSFANALSVHGIAQKVIAAACGVNETTFYRWKTGRTPAPRLKRQSIDRALGDGASVDWAAYDRECEAMQAEKSAAQPRKPEPAPRTALRPETPASEPENAPQAKKSFWANLIHDDTAEAEHAV